MAPPPPNNVDVKFYDLPKSSITSTYYRGGGLLVPPVTSYYPAPKRSRTGTSSFFSRYDKKWRWWHFLSTLIVLLGVLEAAALVTGYTFLRGQSSTVRIALRQYPSIPYKHLDTTVSLANLQKGTTIYHVTKEFGPASTGNLGVTVTALAAAQQRTGLNDVRIVMPYYSFLKNKYEIEKVTDLVVDIRDKKHRPVPIEFRVWKMTYVFDPPPPPPPSNMTVWQVIDGVNTSISVAPSPEPPKPIPLTERVPVYLIGPGNRRPFSQAFRARNALQIYTASPVGLPREWQDQFFSKAAASFLTHQATAVDEESLFAPIRLAPHIDIVHLHGASTALIAKHLNDKRESNQLGPKPPAVVYTMHDYLHELQYTNALSNVRKFMDEEDEDGFQQYLRGSRMFMSSLGIDYANVVTIIGRTMASDIVEGRFEFYLKELVMESVLKKAEEQRFFGISNGMDFKQLNPFTDERLVKRKIQYPEYGLDLVLRQQPVKSSGRIAWPLSTASNDYVTTSKDRAKRFLVRRSLLNEQDLKRPMALFIGQFQHDKGLAHFEEAARLFSENGIKFVIIGQPGDYPLEKIEALQTKYPNDVVVMSTPAEQRRWSIFCRSAADFVFVPTRTESFGLTAAEGLWFGSSVISTGAGGLSEYLIDRPVDATWSADEPVRDIRIVRNKTTKAPTVTSSESYNAYLFDVSGQGLEFAIRDAAVDYQRNSASKALREEYVLRMIRSSQALSWDRGQQMGPVHDYRRAYEIAYADRQLPSLNRHEVEEEEALLRRLLRQRQQEALGYHQIEY